MNSTVVIHPGVERRDRHAADYRAGLLAGLAAGVAMVPVMMAMTTFMMEMGPWPAAKMAWSLVAGKEVIQPGFDLVPVMGGMIVHLMLSAAFGLVFAWLGVVIHIGLAGLGAIYGLVLYVTNILMIPKLFPEWAGHMYPMSGMMHFAMAGEHVYFGVVLRLAYYRAWHRT